MAGTNRLPLAALVLLATAVAFVVATSAVPVAAAATAEKYSGRMVIIRAPGARVVSTAGGALSKWQQRRLVEDEVAPELGSGGGLLGAGDHDIGYGALEKGKAACDPNCGARGESYTGRGCIYRNDCPH